MNSDKINTEHANFTVYVKPFDRKDPGIIFRISRRTVNFSYLYTLFEILRAIEYLKAGMQTDIPR